MPVLSVLRAPPGRVLSVLRAPPGRVHRPDESVSSGPGGAGTLSPMHPSRTVGALTVALLAVALLGGCSGSSDDAGAAPASSASSATSATAGATTGTPAAAPTPTPEGPEPAVIATANEDSLEVFTEPRQSPVEQTVTAEQVVSLPGQIPLTFLVIEQSDDWLHVYLPVRPNGSSGWVRLSDVSLATTDYRVEVRLTEHRLLLHKGADVVMDVPVGVGRDEVPTPGGVYYLKELLQPPTPGGTYGAYAYGLSGYSPVLESFAGGAGVIGIHGTNEPETVGTDASHGCIRMLDADITRLVTEFGLPLGTPVEIVA